MWSLFGLIFRVEEKSNNYKIIRNAPFLGRGIRFFFVSELFSNVGTSANNGKIREKNNQLL